MGHSKQVDCVVVCQPNTTFYELHNQSVPYDKAQTLETYYKAQWANALPPYVSSFTLDDARKKMRFERDAREVFAAIVDVSHRILPGNKEPADGNSITHVHNILGGMFMANMITGNQATLFHSDFTDAPNNSRVAARQSFNDRAQSLNVPIAMFISGMSLPVENLGNFEGVCYKTPLKP